MAKYAYKCECGLEFVCEASVHDGPPKEPICPSCKARASRDFKAEIMGQRFHVPVHMASYNTSVKSDFLPSEKDFESPSDPTGENGMKEWKDNHVTRGFREI